MTDHPLFARLVDDAGLFPPEQLEMAAAAARHRADAGAGDPVLTHRFLCPAGRLAELSGQLCDGDRFDVGLISPLEWGTLVDAHQAVIDTPHLRLVALEGPLPDADDLATAARLAAHALTDLPYGPPRGFPRHVEVPLTDGWPEALDVLADAGLAAKVRCGGVRADLFPTVEQLAAFVHACVARGLPFKATAGLHHAVRHRDPRTGFTHHGFLNLLLAVRRAVGGGGPADIEDVLRADGRAELAAEARAVRPEDAAAARAVFVAYGSCSTSEPSADLRALGLTDPPPPDDPTRQPPGPHPQQREMDA